MGSGLPTPSEGAEGGERGVAVEDGDGLIITIIIVIIVLIVMLIVIMVINM